MSIYEITLRKWVGNEFWFCMMYLFCICVIYMPPFPTSFYAVQNLLFSVDIDKVQLIIKKQNVDKKRTLSAEFLLCSVTGAVFTKFLFGFIRCWRLPGKPPQSIFSNLHDKKNLLNYNTMESVLPFLITWFQFCDYRRPESRADLGRKKKFGFFNRPEHCHEDSKSQHVADTWKVTLRYFDR